MYIHTHKNGSVLDVVFKIHRRLSLAREAHALYPVHAVVVIGRPQRIQGAKLSNEVQSASITSVPNSHWEYAYIKKREKGRERYKYMFLYLYNT